LNSSDFQVSWASIFLLPLQERVIPTLFKNVMIPPKSCKGDETTRHGGTQADVLNVKQVSGLAKT
jgi:hypothetical protein